MKTRLSSRMIFTTKRAGAPTKARSKSKARTPLIFCLDAWGAYFTGNKKPGGIVPAGLHQKSFA